MSSYSDDLFKEITRACRTTAKREVKEEVITLKAHVKELNAEIARLTKENNTMNAKLNSKENKESKVLYECLNFIDEMADVLKTVDRIHIRELRAKVNKWTF